ncbi:hypothetical protein SNE35_25755 [Paucibacter sp. R3-3]|uniref:Uncharacterized protein n=1 Tax=Roseateles agri TaxID=3098619 RepID=A0ABU5DQD9_9BURK|nr:hypothetical protein [Paucibacter sp. R3-3]MDY0747933.1 hypothetical protein [Paucibacter sp. R3-3]
MQTITHKGIIREARRSDAALPMPFSRATYYEGVTFEGGWHPLVGHFFATPAIGRALEKAIEARSPVELVIAEHHIPNVGRPIVSLRVDGKAYAMRPVKWPGIVRWLIFNAVVLILWIFGILFLPIIGGVWLIILAINIQGHLRALRKSLATLNKYLRSLKGSVEFV